MTRRRLVVVAMHFSAVLACGAEPAFLDQRRVSRDQACARLEAAVRRKCGAGTPFDCNAYYQQTGEDCGGPQRESDVARCESRVDHARTCDEALDTTCGMACPAPSWLPAQWPTP